MLRKSLESIDHSTIEQVLGLKSLRYRLGTKIYEHLHTDVIKKIALHAKKGDFNMHWYESFNTGVREKLIKDGYTIGNTSYDQRDGATTKIIW